MKALAYAARALPRDVRVREMRVLATALAIAVGALSAVGFFTDRVDRAMAARATSLLAADLVVEADDEIPPDWASAAGERGLRTAGFVSFPSVIVAGERNELVSLKAVTSEYPLRGELRVANAPYGDGEVRASGPEPGTVWLDPRLFARLDVAVGERIPVGARDLRIAGALVHEPDRAGALFQLAPRLMMSRSDLDSTGLVTPASRVDHHLLVAGGAQAVGDFRDWALARAPDGFQLRGVEDARPEMRRALDRARIFLGLAAVLSVVLAGAAVAVSVHALGGREADTSALLRCFGATQRLVVTALLLRLFAAGIVASAVGVGAGWLAQEGLVALVGSWFGDRLPTPSAMPALTGLAAGLVTLVGFGLVPALRIRRVPVMRVLKGGQSPPEPSAIAAGTLAVAAVALLVYRQAGDPGLAAWVVGGVLGMLLVLTAAGWLLVRLLGRLRGRSVSGVRFGLANLARRARTSTVQLTGFGLGLLALLLLAVVRVDVLDAWQRELPAKAPNQFMINVQPGNVDAVRERLEAAGIDPTGFYPMVRGRLVAIDGEPVSPSDFEAGRGRGLVEREFNLSWASDHRPDNEIIAGQWWSTAEATREREFSVETGIAETLGIALGDTLTFRVAGTEHTARVTNLREVDWDSFKVNFFVIATPATLEEAPATWITSYWAPPDSGRVISELVRAYPGVTVLDVEQILEQVRSIIEQGTRAVEYVFLFTLLAGIVVLVAAVHATREERRTEIALLRTLGASRARVRAIVIAEFGALGGLAGLVAAAGAAATGWAVTTRVLDLPYHFNPWLVVLGVGAGMIGIALAGLAATRHLVAERPLAVLRGG